MLGDVSDLDTSTDSLRGIRLEEKTVEEVEGHFLVPSYQRGYRWGRHEVAQLLDDIRDSGTAKYYLQPIVVRRVGNTFELIDGQQRLTTLLLILQNITGYFPQATINYSIDYETRPKSRDYLANPDLMRRDDNIDFFHMYEASECIKEWFEAEPNPTRAAINLYTALGERVHVIWYEVPPEVDATVLFTRLNVGRIPLTDAELVKAVLLSKSGDRQREVAAQWDAIEHDLRHDDVWSFVSSRDQDDATRIGLLLDTLAGGKLGRARKTFETFEALEKRIDETSAEAVWKEVVALHARVMSWHADRSLYHKIGFLVADGFGLDNLVEPATTLAHSEFERHLDELIRTRLSSSPEELVALRYQDYEESSRVLLLMNVEAARRREESSERYSFAAYLRREWSLEHIEPQADLPLVTNEQRREWLRRHRDALRSLPDLDPDQAVKLVDEIDAAVADISGPLFGQLADKLNPLFRGSADEGEPEYVHSLANLALLARDDNNVLSNSWFEVKRRSIVELDQRGSYIPPCTRNVFLKYFTNADAQQIHFWSPQDRDAYLDAILKYVGPYLTPDVSSDA